MSELLMSQLAVTNMVYMHFSFDYFLDSCDRLGIHQLELYGCRRGAFAWPLLCRRKMYMQ